MQLTHFRVRKHIARPASNPSRWLMLRDVLVVASLFEAGEARPHYSGECGKGGDIPEYDSLTKSEHEAALAFWSRCDGDAG